MVGCSARAMKSSGSRMYVYRWGAAEWNEGGGGLRGEGKRFCFVFVSIIYLRAAIHHECCFSSCWCFLQCVIDTGNEIAHDIGNIQV